MQAPSIDSELRDVAQRFDLLQHPFYQRWVAGDLSRGELAYYTEQYGHVVRALPRWLAEAAVRDGANADALRRHAAEESDHIAMWERFAWALDIDAESLRDAPPNAATAAFIATGDELVSIGHGAAVVWSIEAQSPAVSAEKLRGLRAHYGIDARSGGEYFAVHQELDREHEAALRDVMRSHDAPTQIAAPQSAAATLACMWDLLSAIPTSSGNAA
ncbi:MAG: iron-containing redox enzyme family protein [Candidatus Eremiobacteraeota bacterium]|nr:iron-containing redox enzyme family protein [Candidatus Eremiobacteraeota bacterium]